MAWERHQVITGYQDIISVITENKKGRKSWATIPYSRTVRLTMRQDSKSPLSPFPCRGTLVPLQGQAEKGIRKIQDTVICLERQDRIQDSGCVWNSHTDMGCWLVKFSVVYCHIPGAVWFFIQPHGAIDWALCQSYNPCGYMQAC